MDIYLLLNISLEQWKLIPVKVTPDSLTKTVKVLKNACISTCTEQIIHVM